jgi:hypothetical protein
LFPFFSLSFLPSFPPSSIPSLVSFLLFSFLPCFPPYLLSFSE